MSTATQEKYNQVRNLINLGKDRGFLLLDEVNEILPAGEHTAEEIDDLFSTLERNGIHIHQDLAEAAARSAPEVVEPTAFDQGVDRVETDLDLTVTSGLVPVRDTMSDGPHGTILTCSRRDLRCQFKAEGKDEGVFGALRPPATIF